MSVEIDVKHPLDRPSTDLLEVSRHRLEGLPTHMEDRDADVMRVSLHVCSSYIDALYSQHRHFLTVLGCGIYPLYSSFI